MSPYFSSCLFLPNMGGTLPHPSLIQSLRAWMGHTHSAYVCIARDGCVWGKIYVYTLCTFLYQGQGVSLKLLIKSLEQYWYLWPLIERLLSSDVGRIPSSAMLLTLCHWTVCSGLMRCGAQSVIACSNWIDSRPLLLTVFKVRFLLLCSQA